MRIDIDPTSDVPLYQQLRDQVVEGIATGRLHPGDALASVRQLASEFAINAATVGKSYDMLRQEGLVRINRRSGSVIARGPADPPGPDAAVFLAGWSARARTLLAEAVAQGVTREDAAARVAVILDGFGEDGPATNNREV